MLRIFKLLRERQQFAGESEEAVEVINNFSRNRITRQWPRRPHFLGTDKTRGVVEFVAKAADHAIGERINR